MSTMTMNVPLMVSGDRVLVKRMKPQAKKGSLFIPDSAQEKTNYGVCVNAGDDVKNHWFKKPVLVMFGKYSGSEQEIAGKKYLILKEEEIHGIVCDKALVESMEEDGTE